jgi:hypothetical protein
VRRQWRALDPFTWDSRNFAGSNESVDRHGRREAETQWVVTLKIFSWRTKASGEISPAPTSRGSVVWSAVADREARLINAFDRVPHYGIAGNAECIAKES